MTIVYLLLAFFTSILPSTFSASLDVSNSVDHFVTEVVIKSVLSEQHDKLLIDIQLPETALVGFEIYNVEGQIKHLWNAQELSTGQHQLALTLPVLDQGKYLLHIQVGTNIYKQLVLL